MGTVHCRLFIRSTKFHNLALRAVVHVLIGDPNFGRTWAILRIGPDSFSIRFAALEATSLPFDHLALAADRAQSDFSGLFPPCLHMLSNLRYASRATFSAGFGWFAKAMRAQSLACGVGSFHAVVSRIIVEIRPHKHPPPVSRSVSSLLIRLCSALPGTRKATLRACRIHIHNGSGHRYHLKMCGCTS